MSDYGVVVPFRQGGDDGQNAFGVGFERGGTGHSAAMGQTSEDVSGSGVALPNRAGMSVGNDDRYYFVTREETRRPLEVCDDDQMRLVIALSRFGGLRCPSEHLELRWSDVDWDEGLITVRPEDPKEGKGEPCRAHVRRATPILGSLPAGR